MDALQRNILFDTDSGKVSETSVPLEVLNESGLDHQIESDVIGLYPSYVFQTMEGFGCAMTETSCYLLSKMSPEKRAEAIDSWFGADGIGAKFIRMHIDSCDYSLDEYQAVKDPIADPELETFTIDRDRKYMIPVVKEIMNRTGNDLSVLLSPWSPPYQWKTPPEVKRNDASVYGGAEGKVDLSKPGRCFGGRLKPEYYASWAKYLVKYIKAYLDEGINVTMLSVQNEASAATNWDSCIWSGEQERTFLHDHLYPAMKEAGLTEKIGIFIWDHNKERMIEHIDEMMAGDIGDMISGFAYHWYSGDHFEALSMMHEKYPDKVLMHSESCPLHIPGKAFMLDIPEDKRDSLPAAFRELLSRTPSEVDLSDALSYAHDIIGDLNHGMNRWIDWNMIVDKTGGPRHVPGGFAATLVADDDGDFTKAPSYYYIREIAQKVRAGAKRIGLSRYGSEIEAAAVENTDGTISVLLLNRGDKELPAVIRIGGKAIKAAVPPKTLSSVVIS